MKNKLILLIALLQGTSLTLAMSPKKTSRKASRIAATGAVASGAGARELTDDELLAEAITKADKERSATAAASGLATEPELVPCMIPVESDPGLYAVVMMSQAAFDAEQNKRLLSRAIRYKATNRKKGRPSCMTNEKGKVIGNGVASFDKKTITSMGRGLKMSCPTCSMQLGYETRGICPECEPFKAYQPTRK